MPNLCLTAAHCAAGDVSEGSPFQLLVPDSSLALDLPAQATPSAVPTCFPCKTNHLHMPRACSQHPSPPLQSWAATRLPFTFLHVRSEPQHGPPAGLCPPQPSLYAGPHGRLPQRCHRGHSQHGQGCQHPPQLLRVHRLQVQGEPCCPTTSPQKLRLQVQGEPCCPTTSPQKLRLQVQVPTLKPQQTRISKTAVQRNFIDIQIAVAETSYRGVFPDRGTASFTVCVCAAVGSTYRGTSGAQSLGHSQGRHLCTGGAAGHHPGLYGHRLVHCQRWETWPPLMPTGCCLMFLIKEGVWLRQLLGYGAAEWMRQLWTAGCGAGRQW